MRRIITWKKYHRWIGLIVSVFMLIFWVSGIILNHRQLFRSCDVDRCWMPSNYHVANFNNGVVKGSRNIGADSVLVFGVTITDFTLHFSCCFTKLLHSLFITLLNNFTM